ncbi:SIS domain-containing protein [Phenylobacterium sp.]|jgi:phosphoheptose isomerase|uniref:SIS domain-containing protein n=1 Tax=Phenylobacterium sp. TaxID=1871053 RepID=UPI002F3E3B16
MTDASLFPDRLYGDAGAYADAYFERLALAAASLDRDVLSAAGRMLAEQAARGRTIFACGNGGSAAVANHLACDCMKGVRADSGLKPRVHSLSANVELITALANDVGVEAMFVGQLSSLAEPGDVLIAISSSGASPNIVGALAWAKENGLKTVAMTGFSGGPAMEVADFALHVDAANYGLAEDVHQSIMHILAQHLRHSHLTDPSRLGRLKF